MKKFFLITTAIYLFLLALLGVAISYYFITQAYQPASAALGYLSYWLSILIPLIGWLITTGIGLLLKRHWARYSLLVMAGLAIIIGVGYCCIFSSRQGEQIAPALISMLSTIIIGLVIFFFFIIPLANIFFFTRRSVKEQFIRKERRPKKSIRPVGISILSILYLINGASALIYTIYPQQKYTIIFGGFFISGIYLTIYGLINTSINLFISYGFWSLRRSAWYTYIVLGCYGIFTSIINFFTISPETFIERMPDTYREFLNPLTVKIIEAAVLLTQIGLYIYVISQRGIFFKKGVEIKIDSNEFGDQNIDTEVRN